jgi:TATA-box binding protein (TBP) (component of TFIID and TFIIIB)
MSGRGVKKKPRIDATDISLNSKRTKRLPGAPSLAQFNRLKQATAQATRSMLLGMRKAKSPTCAWLTKETHVLPQIVNIVYTVTFESPRFKEPLNLVRLAQYLPNVKYRPPGFASVTIRLYPTTALLSMKGKLVLIRCTTRNMALFYSHYYRQLVEQVPIIMKGPNPEDKPYVGTLEGYLECSIGEIQNMVGNGVLPQDGVHLTRLLYSDQEAVDWDPGGFPNLIYNAKLPTNGKPFCANIAITGKIVLMGLKDIEDVYTAYKASEMFFLSKSFLRAAGHVCGGARL